MSLFENFVYKNGEIVDNSWVKWHHFGVPDEEGSERESMREFLAMLGHCKSCTVLSGCFFVKSRLPKKQGAGKGLLHNNCDCELIKIAKPTKQIEIVKEKMGVKTNKEVGIKVFDYYFKRECEDDE